MAPILRTGIDLIEIDRLEHLNPSIRERFMLRVYTAREREEAQGRFAYLAGRFAAKEAVAKALGSGIGPVSFQEIEIRSGRQGEPVLELHGKARELASVLGLETWSISISHTRTYATAIAVALGSENEDSGRQ